jgi:hypothetical protein
MKADVSTVLTTIVVLVHIALATVDFFGVYSLADFMIRPDGSQMKPNDMLPVEEVLVAMMAFPFFIVVMGFMLTCRKDAAALSTCIHLAFACHQIWKKSVWDAIFHPNSEFLTTDFFIKTHLGWAVISGIIWFLNASPVSSAKKERSA